MFCLFQVCFSDKLLAATEPANICRLVPHFPRIGSAEFIITGPRPFVDPFCEMVRFLLRKHPVAVFQIILTDRSGQPQGS